MTNAAWLQPPGWGGPGNEPGTGFPVYEKPFKGAFECFAHFYLQGWVAVLQSGALTISFTKMIYHRANSEWKEWVNILLKAGGLQTLTRVRPVHNSGYRNNPIEPPAC